ENRVQDKIEIIEGDSREIKLSREFDLFVSETIGNSAFDEEIVPILIDARKRFLKRDAALIPSTVSLIAAPAYLKAGSKKVPSGVPLSCNYFNSLSMNVPRLFVQGPGSSWLLSHGSCFALTWRRSRNHQRYQTSPHDGKPKILRI